MKEHFKFIGEKSVTTLGNLGVWGAELISEYSTNRSDFTQKSIEAMSYILNSHPVIQYTSLQTLWIAVGIGIWTLAEDDLRKARLRYISSKSLPPS